MNTGVDYHLADTSDQYFDIQIDLEISNILEDCDMEGRMAIRDTARRNRRVRKETTGKEIISVVVVANEHFLAATHIKRKDVRRAAGL